MKRSRWAGFLVLAASLAACMDITTGTGTGPGSGAGSSGSSSGGTPSAATGPSGAGCFTDGPSKVTLCEQSSACPTVDVNQGVYPNCGFRMNSSSPFDVECICGDSLCPIGAPTSCSSVVDLLSQQSALTVCGQAGEGRCVLLSGADAGSGAGSSCDKSCESECAGDPSCIKLCGC
jgi:hypothetical protein